MSLWSRAMRFFIRKDCAADAERLDDAFRAAVFQQQTTTEAAKGARVASDHQRARVEVAREQIQRRIEHASFLRPSPPTSEARSRIEAIVAAVVQQQREKQSHHDG